MGNILFPVIHISRLFLKRDPTIILTIQDVISLFQQNSSGIQEIHALGDRAISILETIQKKKLLQSSLTPSLLPSIQHFIIIDRAIDFTSLFITPLTYEGLIDELFNIQMNSISIDATVIGRVNHSLRVFYDCREMMEK